MDTATLCDRCQRPDDFYFQHRVPEMRVVLDLCLKCAIELKEPYEAQGLAARKLYNTVKKHNDRDYHQDL